MGDEYVQEGRVALVSGDWASARGAFAAAVDEADDDPRALEGLGEALWWLNELGECRAVMERAYLGYRSAGQSVQAAGVAIFLARDYLDVNGNWAAYNGWLARAETLLDGAELSPTRGWLLLVRVRAATAEALADSAEEALRIARATGDTDLEAVALAYSGSALASLGLCAQGMTRLDEAMAAVTGGEVRSFFAKQEAYCRMLAACDAVADFRRAEEWCRVIDELSRRHGIIPLLAVCRAFYGGLLVATGRWQEAESALMSSVRAFDSGQKASRFFALVRLAELRLRQGRVEEAEQLLEGLEDLPEALVVSAAAALARSALAVAIARLERVLSVDGLDVSVQARALAALTDVHIRRSQLDLARQTAARLVALAGSSPLPLVTARAEATAGRVARAVGDESCIVHMRRAVEAYAALAMPLEAGQARLDVARALAPRDAEIACVEAGAALATFERLGAARDADAAAALLRQLGASPKPGPKVRRPLTNRESEVLELLAVGLSNPEIADRLYLSRKTVESHVSRILAKLGMRTRTEAVAYALRSEQDEPAERPAVGFD